MIFMAAFFTYFIIGYILGILIKAYQEKNNEPIINQMPVWFTMFLWPIFIIAAIFEVGTDYFIRLAKKFL